MAHDSLRIVASSPIGDGGNYMFAIQQNGDAEKTPIRISAGHGLAQEAEDFSHWITVDEALTLVHGLLDAICEVRDGVSGYTE